MNKPELVLCSRALSLPIQEYSPDRESEYLQLVAYEASDNLKRVKARAEKFRRDELERLIAF